MSTAKEKSRAVSVSQCFIALSVIRTLSRLVNYMEERFL